jgi:poly(A) polymerase
VQHDTPTINALDLVGELPPFEQDVARRLCSVFEAAGAELYLVGGVVRDLLLRRGRADLDFATSATSALTKRLGREAGASDIYTVGEAFGTIGFMFQGPDSIPMTVEITTYRSEVYPTRDRKPSVSHGVSLVDDLSRRDFTINALALHPLSNALIDPFGGLVDLDRRQIRAVGDPAARFDEDPLRILRAVRFSAQLDFSIGEATLEAMRAGGPELGRISIERITAELNRLLVAPAAERGLRVLEEADLVRFLLPELLPLVEDDRAGGTIRHKDIWDHTIKVVGQAPARLPVRWGALLHDAAKPQTRSVNEQGEVHFFGHELAGAALARRMLQRLKQERVLQAQVAQLVAMHSRPSSYGEDWTDSAVRRLALEAGEIFPDLLDLAAADVTSARSERRAAAARRVNGLRAHFERLEAERALTELQSPLDGNDLMVMFDLPPGRWIAHLKDRLRELVIDGELDPDDTATASQLARDWMASGEIDDLPKTR